MEGDDLQPKFWPFANVDLPWLEIIGYYYILSYSPYRLFENLPVWQTFLIAFIAWDFGFYWFHRAHHKFSALWVLHNVHHQGENFNLSLGIRNAWFHHSQPYRSMLF